MMVAARNAFLMSGGDDLCPYQTPDSALIVCLDALHDADSRDMTSWVGGMTCGLPESITRNADGSLHIPESSNGLACSAFTQDWGNAGATWQIVRRLHYTGSTHSSRTVLFNVGGAYQFVGVRTQSNNWMGWPEVFGSGISTSGWGYFSWSPNIAIACLTIVAPPNSPAQLIDYRLDGNGSRTVNGTTIPPYSVAQKTTNPSVICQTNQHYNYDFYSFRAYSRALTAAEVAANYAIDAARFGI